MNNSFQKKKPVRVSFVIIIALMVIAGSIIIAMSGQSKTPKKAAEIILTTVYSATLNDFDTITSTTSTKSTANDAAVLNYVHSKYPELFTEHGYGLLLKNRIPFRALEIAHKESTDIKVTSIKLDPTDAEAGSSRYNYVVQVETSGHVRKTFTFNGHIKLVQENCFWKIEAIS